MKKKFTKLEAFIFESSFIKIMLAVVAAFTVTTGHAQQVAFPGAEGAGQFTSGGRGTPSTATTVFEVTNLTDVNSPGSLRYACSQSTSTYPYRTIVFRVSGTIHLNSRLTIPGNTTIAGQTAPGDGICLADYPVAINGNNVIIRYIRCRMGDRFQKKVDANGNPIDGSGGDDALGDLGHKNLIIDHCSVSWSTDEALTVYRGDSVTLQWNYITEPLNYSYHFEAGDTDWENHGYGGIQGGQHASIHHNLYAHCRNRTPRFSSINSYTPAVPGAELADFRNNVIYNWGINNVYGGEGGYHNMVNNYFKYGPSTSSRKYQVVAIDSSLTEPYAKYYLSGNYVDGSTTNTNNNWLSVSMKSGKLSDTFRSKVTVPFDLPAVNTQTSAEAFASVLAIGGCSLPKRDTLDQRVTNDVRNRTGRIIDVQGGYPHGTPYDQTVNAWPALQSLPAPTDSDHDGMPDEWETQRGLNPSLASDRNGYTANGYTNIENYLNGDSIVAPGTLNTCVNAKTVRATNSNKWLDAKDTTYTRLVSTDTTNMVASIYDNGNYGNFNVSYYVTNTTRRTVTNTAYLNRNVTVVPENPLAVTTPVTMRIYFSTAEFNALKAADPGISSVNDLKVYVSPEVTCGNTLTLTPTVITPTAYNTFGTYQNGYYVEFATATFGTFYLSGSDALPLSLVSFSGALETKQVRVSWKTVNEVNTKRFTIERSLDGTTFNAIGNVAAKNASANNYSFVDAQPVEGVSYYRLKIEDNDGSFKYSRVVTINNRLSTSLSLFPNPAKNSITISYRKASSNSSVTISNTEGRKIVTHMLPVNSTQSTVDISPLSAGTYMVTLYNGSSVENVKLVKQ